MCQVVKSQKPTQLHCLTPTIKNSTHCNSPPPPSLKTTAEEPQDSSIQPAHPQMSLLIHRYFVFRTTLTKNNFPHKQTNRGGASSLFTSHLADCPIGTIANVFLCKSQCVNCSELSYLHFKPAISLRDREKVDKSCLPNLSININLHGSPSPVLFPFFPLIPFQQPTRCRIWGSNPPGFPPAVARSYNVTSGLWEDETLNGRRKDTGEDRWSGMLNVRRQSNLFLLRAETASY